MRFRLLLAFTCFAVACVEDDEPLAQFFDAALIGTFEPTPCTFEAPANLAGRELRCGYVYVPEHHAADVASPQRALRLSVAQFIGASAAKRPATIWLEGGPGASSLPNGKILFEALGGVLANERDFVLFDQRGTGVNQPSIECPNEVETYDDLDTCYRRLQNAGHDLTAYNSVENAGDVDVLRRALGYDKVTLYGASYGSRLALHVLRRYGAAVDSVVVDGVLPPNVDWLPSAAQATQDGFVAVAGACAADPACNAAYPNLQQVFLDTLRKLGETPIELTVVETSSGEMSKLLFDRATFAAMVRDGLEVPGFPSIMPRLIYEVRDLANGAGAGQTIETTANAVEQSNEALARVFSLSMHLLVSCSEHGPFTAEDIVTEGIPADFVDLATQSLALYLRACPIWGQAPLDSAEIALVNSNVPALVFSGQFDAQTPPRYAAAAEPGLSKRSSLVFESYGHVAIGNPCADTVLAQFLSNPAAALDTSCTNELQTKFSLPQAMNALKAGSPRLVVPLPAPHHPFDVLIQ